MKILLSIILLIFTSSTLFAQDYNSLLAKAEQGDADAQFALGGIYDDGSAGRFICPVESFYWYEKSAKQGHALAQYVVALMYNNSYTSHIQGHSQDSQRAGDWVEINEEKYAFWVQKSAESGYAQAQIRIAALYFEGEGVLKNPNKGIYWIKKSANEGHHIAQLYLGLMYFDVKATLNEPGKIVYWLKRGELQKDSKKAVYWLGKSAEQGNHYAQYYLGLLFCEGGEGVGKNLKQAAYWIEKAFNNGNKEAKKVWEEYELWKYI